jgi:hypothetical protein
MLANLNSPRNSLPRYTANEDGSLMGRHVDDPRAELAGALANTCERKDKQN